MPHLVPISGKKLLKILEKNGFVCIRIHGSHHFMHSKKRGVTTTIPIHGNMDLDRGLLRKIITDINITLEEYNKMIR